MSDGRPPVEIEKEDIYDLTDAKMLLENPGLTARLANVLGAPIEKGFALLPEDWAGTVQNAVRAALFRALGAQHNQSPEPKPRFGILSQGHGGSVRRCGRGLRIAGPDLELPISTTIMLRSIADIARTEGHNLDEIQTKLNCLEVFALGGRTKADDASESTYWAVRAALSRAVSEAASYFAEKGLIEKSAPAVARLVAAIASRFGVVVSEQVAAKAIPILGAAGGSLVNVLFMDHFQSMARGHFIVKTLEKKYGPDLIREVYDSIAIPVR